jgi:hypothetical protein
MTSNHSTVAHSQDLLDEESQKNLIASNISNNLLTNDINQDEKCFNNDCMSAELPFLVTHWLAGYQPTKHQRQESNKGYDKTEKDGDDEKLAAVQKIHRAAADLASAFATLSAFGSNVAKVRILII